MVWNGNRHGAHIGPALHDDVASTPAHLGEPMLQKDTAHFASERTRSLPMLGFDPRYKDLALEPSCDLFWIRALEE